MPFSPWLGGHSQASRQEEACLFPLQTGWEHSNIIFSHFHILAQVTLDILLITAPASLLGSCAVGSLVVQITQQNGKYVDEFVSLAYG